MGIPFLSSASNSIEGIFIILFGLAGSGGLILAFMKSYRAKAYEIMEQASTAWKARYDAEATETAQLNRKLTQQQDRIDELEKAVNTAKDNLSKTSDK